METSHYSSWVELFKIHCTVNQVIDHIVPTQSEAISDGKTPEGASEPEGSNKEKEKSPKSDKELWSRLNAIVLQWIYGTISTDLLHTILKPGSTAKQAWERLENIFQDNKASRAVHLENQFTRVHMDDYPNISAYCQELKMLADQLSSVGAPVSEQRLVLQLIAGLNENYDGVAIFIQQSNPLPLFHEARSRLILEETRKAKQTAAAASAAGTALLTTNGSNDDNSGRNRGSVQVEEEVAVTTVTTVQSRSMAATIQWTPYSQWGPWGQQAWAVPPCPYPTSNWTRPPSNCPTATTGSRPPQAYSAHVPTPSNYAPTDIDAAMQNLSINIPDENWYMDTGATSHMTASQGTLSSYSNLSINKNIIVGSGQEIPIRGYGQKYLSPPHPPLSLNNVLHAPKLIKNLISVRRFTIDNNVTIEFDPFGFSVKDIQTGMPLMRCDSTGDLYPITTTTRPQPTSTSTFAALHVIFDETQFPFAKIHTPSTHSYEFLSEDLHPLLHYHLQNYPNQAEPEPHTTETPQTTTTPSSYTKQLSQNIPPPSPLPINLQPDLPISIEPTSPAHTLPTHHISQEPSRTMATRSMHGIHKPKRQFNLTTSITPSPLPHNPKAALSDPNWKAAMLDEFDALIKNKTWELVPRPSNVNVIRSMWIFRHKKKSDGSFERHKARLVGDGRSQQVGLDCDETFSPVVKPTTIRIVLTIALSKSWSIHQLDVKNAFLHGKLHETVYMHQPMGFRDSVHPDYVCLLKKSLYGLKQAPRAWYQRFADFIFTFGFFHSKSDHSLFIYRKGNDMAYILLYVDDIILTASSDVLRQSIMSLLASEFAMKDLGTLSYFLGIAVTHHADGLFLSQRKYAAEIIERAGMTSCKPTTTPVDTKPKLSISSGSPYKDPTQYRRLAGALQYLTFTRPDISYAVQQVCLHMHDPKDEHMNALKRILRYIQGTLDHGLHLYKSPVSGLTSYTDADWGGCPDTRRSTSGYCIFLGDNLISWSSKRQPTLSRSSAEAEYRGVANVVSESCWIRNLLLELHCPIHKATLVHCDNISAIYLSGNPVQHQRTKHIEMDIHFVREKVARGQVRVLHVPSRYQIADIFTKGLPRVLFEDFRDSLSIRRPPASTAGV
ncbi:hypothetical protein TSUD_254980 [Trifolium subterraneum]|uniref:Uncharacterized protein n=1 Tax=Trifolium subterraneum TaxID=3900 RepID=A0A2Z6LJJ8_TRISU|nr:hypothetical protein TSUD_254980 [Trifolium subterraneum]